MTANGVSLLADRPNQQGQYGQSGLSAAQLKAWFDKLSLLIAQKVNAIIDAFGGAEAAKYIDTGIVKGAVTLSLQIGRAHV